MEQSFFTLCVLVAWVCCAMSLDVNQLNQEAIQYAQKQQYKKAVELMKQAVGMSPQRADLHNNLGVIQMRASMLDEAKLSFETALRLQPDNTEAPANLNALKGHFEYRRKRNAADNVEAVPKTAEELMKAANIPADTDYEPEEEDSGHSNDGDEFPALQRRLRKEGL